jgi:hypothetical protein
MTRNEYDRHLHIGLSQFRLQIEPAPSRQPNVQNQASRAVPRFVLLKFLNRAESSRLQTNGLKQANEPAPQYLIVINDENSRRIRCLGFHQAAPYLHSQLYPTCTSVL